MKNAAYPFLVIFVLFFLENALHVLFPDQTFPLLLIAVIFFALKRGMIFGALAGAWAGVLLEVFKTGVFGFAAIPLAAIGAASGFMSSKLFRESFLAQIMMPVASFYFFEAVNLGIVWAPFFASQLLLTAVLSPLVFHFLKKITESSPSRRSARWLL